MPAAQLKGPSCGRNKQLQRHFGICSTQKVLTVQFLLSNVWDQSIVGYSDDSVIWTSLSGSGSQSGVLEQVPRGPRQKVERCIFAIIPSISNTMRDNSGYVFHALSVMEHLKLKFLLEKAPWHKFISDMGLWSNIIQFKGLWPLLFGKTWWCRPQYFTSV